MRAFSAQHAWLVVAPTSGLCLWAAAGSFDVQRSRLSSCSKRKRPQMKRLFREDGGALHSNDESQLQVRSNRRPCICAAALVQLVLQFASYSLCYLAYCSVSSTRPQGQGREAAMGGQHSVHAAPSPEDNVRKRHRTLIQTEHFSLQAADEPRNPP